MDSFEIYKEKDYLNYLQYSIKLFAYEQFKIKYSEKFRQNVIIVISDERYFKKYNLSNDSSEWEGRIIKAFDTENRSVIHFCYLRRSFIPPFCDKYQDFIINAVEDISDFIKKFPKDWENRQLNYICRENYKFDKHFEMMINSIYNLEDNKVINFTNILKYLYNTLSLDYSSLNFLTNKVSVIGEEIFLIGLKFVYSLLWEIRSKITNEISHRNKDSLLSNENSNFDSKIDHEISSLFSGGI